MLIRIAWFGAVGLLSALLCDVWFWWVWWTSVADLSVQVAVPVYVFVLPLILGCVIGCAVGASATALGRRVQ